MTVTGSADPQRRPKPRLLLVGAGRAEIGVSWANQAQADGAYQGVLPWLLDSILAQRAGRLFPNGEWPFEVALTMRFDGLLTLRRSGRRGVLSNRDAEKLRRAMLLAEVNGLDGVAVLIDREALTQPDRAERLRRGRTAYRAADQSACVACAVGAACRSVETWLLVDPGGRARVFGSGAPNPFSADPERRPSPRDLKSYIEQWCGQCGISRDEAYERLAKAASPGELRCRCPTSYPPFADDVDSEIGPLMPSS